MFEITICVTYCFVSTHQSSVFLSNLHR
ncbi:hypothetical protein MED222_05150 [Vibrio sp. MED222]|nr:hypothetical protein MED222_05150 [Vibrio sp. MED222]